MHPDGLACDLGERVAAINDAFNHDFDPAAAFLLSEEPCLDHPRIVENQQVTGFDELRQVGELPVMQYPRAYLQQSARRALARRVLGYQFGRQVEIKIVEGEHAGKLAGGRSDG